MDQGNDRATQGEKINYEFVVLFFGEKHRPNFCYFHTILLKLMLSYSYAKVIYWRPSF
jgi:hypothetical protein